MTDGGDNKADEVIGRHIEWTVHPVKRNPTRSLLATIFVLVVSLMVYYITASPFFSMLSLVFLFGSLAKFYFPTSYRMTEKQVIVKTRMQTLAKDWSSFRSSYPDKNGVLLSPFPEPTRLENFRGLYLMTDQEHRDEVIAFVRSCLGSTRRVADATSSTKTQETNEGER